MNNDTQLFEKYGRSVSPCLSLAGQAGQGHHPNCKMALVRSLGGMIVPGLQRSTCLSTDHHRLPLGLHLTPLHVFQPTTTFTAMVFTPPTSFVIRSREYSNGTEFSDGLEDNLMPDHYVRRLWRQPTMSGPGGKTIQFINKDSTERAVLYSLTEAGSSVVMRKGNASASGQEIARAQWDHRNPDRSQISLDNQSGLFKDVIKKSGAMSYFTAASVTQTRAFIGPDGQEYKWKVVLEGDNAMFPDSYHRTLYRRGIAHPLATTARLVQRDGDSGTESFPIYIAEDGMWMESWIVASVMLLQGYDRLTN
ncbi:hypothetical protein CYLTODRAFT_485994 [Cylindrobasidium torrendii FP15055 ss-10]|uniref:DUF6593 domain-containing protein n=1 Tax=Cylindrobasidium torrendii FP15055 ss-10 TaxID=1314674 RepID=A0A0D7BT30_9AGAR|nr:hypothetical protein CYLTODRAFT_485994 [Cylindrobasidium torrendii FP15055 ss-10]